jgi:hypothetical protein
VTVILNCDHAPSHLSSISELDLSGTLFPERLNGPWFRLGAWTITSARDARGVKDEVMRQSLLLTPEGFVDEFVPDVDKRVAGSCSSNRLFCGVAGVTG